MSKTSAKRNRSWRLATAGAAALALAAGGCFVTTEVPPTPRREIEPTLPPPVTQGTFVLRWMIDGTTDPTECTKSASSELEVVLVDHQSGRQAGAWRQNCQVYSLSVRLDPGTYSGSATLLDAAGHPRTTSVTIDAFTLRGNDTIDIPVDFPGNSFF